MTVRRWDGDKAMVYRTIVIGLSHHSYFCTCAICKKMASDVNMHLAHYRKQRKTGSIFYSRKFYVSLLIILKSSKMFQLNGLYFFCHGINRKRLHLWMRWPTIKGRGDISYILEWLNFYDSAIAFIWTLTYIHFKWNV